MLLNISPQVLGGRCFGVFVHPQEEKPKPDVRAAFNQLRVEHLEPVDEEADLRFVVSDRLRRLPVFALQQHLGHRVDQGVGRLLVDGFFNLPEKMDTL